MGHVTVDRFRGSRNEKSVDSWCRRARRAVVADSAEATGNWSSIIFWMISHPLGAGRDWPVAGLFGQLADYDPAAFDILVAVGDNATRRSA